MNAPLLLTAQANHQLAMQLRQWGRHVQKTNTVVLFWLGYVKLALVMVFFWLGYVKLAIILFLSGLKAGTQIVKQKDFFLIG